MANFGRVIDLDRCIGCQACASACSVENKCSAETPWQVVLSHEVGIYPNVKETYTPVGCMHCVDAPCEKICHEIDVHAISTNDYGIVIFDYDKCIACGYCEPVCPYGVPQFKTEKEGLYPYDDATPYEAQAKEQNHPLHQKKHGKAEKCTSCWHKLESAIEANRADRIGLDPEYTPTCDLVCPVNARVFGDLDDPNSNVSQWIGNKSAGQMKKEFGTNPRVFYVSKGGDY